MKKIGILATVLCAWTTSTAAFAAEDGSWTLMLADEAGMVHFTVIQRHQRGTSHSASDWPVSAFQGLDLATRARHDVTFAIARDAGRFDCEGYLANGEGAGTFRFTPDPAFTRAMSDLGFGGIDEDEQFGMAMHDVSLDFARQMKGENVAGMDSDKLIAFTIHGVSPEFVAQLASLGYANVESDELVAMRIHGVTPEYISDLRSRGLRDLSIDKLIALRIHGID
jgi:hypothetical protein